MVGVLALLIQLPQKAVNSRLGRADNAKFLERFRYMVVASQLLNTHSYLGQAGYSRSRDVSLPSPEAPQLGAVSLVGVGVTAFFSFALAGLIHWTRSASSPGGSKRRFVLLPFLMVVLAIVSYAYMRRQWLQYLRQQTLAETTEFLAKSQDFDTAVAGTLTLIQEVELVSRGYS